MKVLRFFAHLLVPHESNNHKAKVLQPSGILVLALFLLANQLFLHFLPKVSPRILGYAANISPAEVVRLTNEKRVANGVIPLTENAALSQAAQAKAADMIAKGYWAHVAPDGTQPWRFFLDAGYKYKYAGENLARDFADPASTVNAWMASSSHRENLLSDKYRDIGVAVIDGKLSGVDTTIVVQLFGTTLAATSGITKPVAAATSTVTEIVPTSSPEVVAQVNTAPVVAAAVPKSLVSPFSLTRQLSGIIIAFLLVVLVIDMVIIGRKRVTRVSGRSFAHIAFFGMIFAIVLIARAGRIL